MKSPLKVQPQTSWIPKYSLVPTSSSLTFFFQPPLIQFIVFFAIFLKDRSGLLSEQEAKALFHRHPVSGELVIRGESSRVGRAGWLPIRSDFLLVK